MMLTALLLLSFAQLTTTPTCAVSNEHFGEYEIAPVLPGQTCDPKPAFDSIMAAHMVSTGQNVRGPLVHMRYGDYEPSGILQVGMLTTVRGSCVECTVIRTATTAFEAMYRTKAEDLGLGRNGDLVLEDMTLISTQADELAVHHGVKASKRVTITNVQIFGFFTGIELSCDVQSRTGHAQSNCNNSWIRNVYITDSSGPAIHTKGGDSGGSLVSGGLFINNCKQGDALKYAFGDGEEKCAAVYDSSLIQNTFVGLAGENQIDDVTGEQHPHYVIGEANNAGSMAFGMYAENGPPYSGRVGNNAGVIGGGTWIGGGYVQRGPRANGIRYVNDLDIDNKIELAIGTQVGAGSYAWTMRRNTSTDWLYFGYREVRDAWWWNVKNAPAQVPFYIGASPLSPYGAGKLKIEFTAP